MSLRNRMERKMRARQGEKQADFFFVAGEHVFLWVYLLMFFCLVLFKVRLTCFLEKKSLYPLKKGDERMRNLLGSNVQASPVFRDFQIKSATSSRLNQGNAIRN